MQAIGKSSRRPFSGENNYRNAGYSLQHFYTSVPRRTNMIWLTSPILSNPDHSDELLHCMAFNNSTVLLRRSVVGKLKLTGQRLLAAHVSKHTTPSGGSVLGPLKLTLYFPSNRSHRPWYQC